MKTIIIEKCAKNEMPMEQMQMQPWCSSHNNWSNKHKKSKGVLKMLLEEAKQETTKINTNRLRLTIGFEDRNIQALFEDLDYLDRRELNLYAVNF